MARRGASRLPSAPTEHKVAKVRALKEVGASSEEKRKSKQVVASAKHLATMVRPMGRVEGTGWLVRPSEVRLRQEMPSKERRRQRGHLGGDGQDLKYDHEGELGRIPSTKASGKKSCQ